MINFDWYWIQKKIPKQEKICVQYMGKGQVVAISTIDNTKQFKIYKIDRENKKILLLGKGKNINKLENKFLSVPNIEEGYIIN